MVRDAKRHPLAPQAVVSLWCSSGPGLQSAPHRGDRASEKGYCVLSHENLAREGVLNGRNHSVGRISTGSLTHSLTEAHESSRRLSIALNPSFLKIARVTVLNLQQIQSENHEPGHYTQGEGEE